MQRNIALAASLDELEGLLAAYGPRLTPLAAANAAASTVRLLKPLREAAEAGAGRAAAEAAAAAAAAGSEAAAARRYRGKGQRALLLPPGVAQRTQAMLAPLVPLLESGMGSLRPQAAISAVTALHKLGLPVGHLGPLLLAHCTRQLAQLDGNFVAGMLSGLATLGVPQREFLESQQGAVLAKLEGPGMTVASLCSLLWCAASVGLGDSELARRCVQELLAHGFPEGTMTAQVPVSLWAAAQAASPDVQLFRRAAPVLLGRAGALQPQQLASTVWALGKAGYADPELLGALARRAAQLAARFTDAELTTVLGSLMHLQHDPAQLAQLWVPVAPVAAARLLHYSPVEVAALAHFMTRLRLHHAPLVERMGDYVMARGEALLLGTLSNLLWLFGDLEPQRDEVLRKLARLAMHEVRQRGARHPVQTIVSCAAAMGERAPGRGLLLLLLLLLLRPALAAAVPAALRCLLLPRSWRARARPAWCAAWPGPGPGPRRGGQAAARQPLSEPAAAAAAHPQAPTTT
jgi:hypothetical protein